MARNLSASYSRRRDFLRLSFLLIMSRVLLSSVVLARRTPILWRRCTPAAVIPPHQRRRYRREITDNSFRLFSTTSKDAAVDEVSTKTDSTEPSEEDLLETSSVDELTDLQPPKRKNLLRRAQQLTGDLFSALGFVTSSTTALLFDRRQFQRLKPSVLALRQFLKTSGIDLELSHSLNSRLLNNIVILGRVHAVMYEGKDRRDDALSEKTNLSIPTEEEALRYMRYATASYGNSMIRAVEIGVTGRFDNRMKGRATRTCVSNYIGVREEDVVKMDLDYHGNGNHLRHFVAVDHDNRKVVLAIRGTFSLSEIVVDVAGFSAEFCGGEAHSEMASMAHRVWDEAGETVLSLLHDNPDYELILTGHSLGAGTACLLNILCHRNGRALVKGRPVRCFAYASPPVFTPLEFAPDAVRSCTNYIQNRDAVPFLSVNSVRHLFASVRAIEEQGLRWRERMQLLTGYLEPNAALVQRVRELQQKRLPPKKGAPVLEIPAAANLWLRRKDDNANEYDVKVCDSRKLAQLEIRVDANMLKDHIPTYYEDALHDLV